MLFDFDYLEQTTVEERVLVNRTCYKYNASPTATVRELRARLGCNVAPNELSVRRLVKKSETTGSVLNLKKTMLSRLVRTNENIAIVYDKCMIESP